MKPLDVIWAFALAFDSLVFVWLFADSAPDLAKVPVLGPVVVRTWNAIVHLMEKILSRIGFDV